MHEQHPDCDQIALLADQAFDEQQKAQKRGDRGDQHLIKVAALAAKFGAEFLLLERRLQRYEGADLRGLAHAEKHQPA